MFKSILILHLMCCVLTVLVVGQTQEKEAAIAFPETEVHMQLDDKKKNADNRIPIFHPTVCKANELYYPGDQKDDWVCDCLPAHVYYPPADKCFPVYEQGPCQEGQYLILPKQKNIPACVPNPCRISRMVPFQNQCYDLLKPGPCPLPELSNVVGINITTLNIECIRQSTDVAIGVANRFGVELPNPIGVCAKGTKRAYDGTCVPTLDLYSLPA